MNKKTIIAGLLTALLAMSLILAGCGRKQEVAKPEAQKKLKVALVFDVGGRGDKSFNDAAYAGLEKAQKEFGDKIEVKFLEPAASGENREQLLRLLAQDKYDLIFGVGAIFTDPVAKVAGDFPGTKFGLVDGSIPALKAENNVVCLLFREQEGSFLTGAAAALKSKAGKIGFVGRLPLPLTEKLEAGYIAGAKYVKPDIVVLSDRIDPTDDAFKDPVKGKELALEQLKNGADVVFYASGASGIGVIETVAAQKALAIGMDFDQSLAATDAQRPFLLTSMTRWVDTAVYDTIKNLVGNSFKGGYQEFGVKENGTGYAENEYNRNLNGDIKSKLDAVRGKIVSGEIKVAPSRTEPQ
ncbi:MAG TPA: BMP family ABC transporter substrate-binding protein [Selenomonadales bacterium]|nr:BMP family ABC transporter substrate-binding protein [Selenomonadales bacterium]